MFSFFVFKRKFSKVSTIYDVAMEGVSEWDSVIKMLLT